MLQRLALGCTSHSHCAWNVQTCFPAISRRTWVLSLSLPARSNRRSVSSVAYFSRRWLSRQWPAFIFLNFIFFSQGRAVASQYALRWMKP